MKSRTRSRAYRLRNRLRRFSMSRMYIILVALAAGVISVTGAAFSIVGLAQLFAGSAVAVGIMAGALEFGKIVSTGFLYRYWGHINAPMRIYLCFAVVTLMGITSMGIFAFLTNAYQKSSISLKSQMLQVEGLENEDRRIKNQIEELRQFIDAVPPSRISQKFAFQREYAPQIKDLLKRSEEIHVKIDNLNMELLSTQTKVGPVIYVAKALGTDIDTVVKWLTTFFVSVFDPLAICLVFCWNLAIRLQEKYRRNEVRISQHALASPVDHRYTKKRKPLKRLPPLRRVS